MDRQPPIRCYIIAGETSGEQLGANLMRAMRMAAPVEFQGIGGTLMQAEGMQSLFPMEELSLMGFLEILPHIFRLKKRIRQTAQHIMDERPDVVVSIDSPGFVFRVARLLREQGYTASPLIHYVAPTVWAYKPERAAKTASLFDRLLTLFAFEVPYFTKEGLSTFWVGHPAAWKERPHHAPIEHPALCAFPGSRRGELKRHLPLYRDICARLKLLHPSLTVTMPVPARLKPYVENATQHWPCPLHIVGSDERDMALATSHAVLCKSGTITLECALAGVPGIVTYKANPISVWLVRRMALISHVALPNILLGREVIPEFLQPHIDPEQMSTALSGLLTGGEAAHAQKEAFAELRQLLLPEKERSPSEIAASYVLQAARNAAVSSS